jgi:hypothetical protein
MSKVAISGDGSGTGTFTITSPNSNNNRTITLPDSTGTIALTSDVSSFPSGTVMLFGQTSAPTGWTKDTTNYNNSALRVVTGSASTGGSVDFTTAFASGLSAGATTLTTTQIPSHTHTVTVGNTGCGATVASLAFGPVTTINSGATGGGGSHTHTIPSFAVKYVDVIRATQD